MFKSGFTPLSNYIDILHPLSNNVYLITGDDGYDFFKNDGRIQVNGVFHQKGETTISKVKNYIITQFKISYLILKLRNNIDISILFFGGHALILPILTLKLLNKTVIITLADYAIKYNQSKTSKILLFLSCINLHLADKINIYSPCLINEWNLERYQNKIIIASRHFIDFSKFKMIKSHNFKDNLIGYVGRFSIEKGIMNLVLAIPMVLKEKPNFKYILIGDGPLTNEIKEYLFKNNLRQSVEIIGWISHDELPEYLNELKLVVLPSYTEGLPNIMLESMICGTPVLANPVGSIPDIIKDGENGFLMKNNSPECIAKNIIRVINSSKVDYIIGNAYNQVSQDFTFDDALVKYRSILKES